MFISRAHQQALTDLGVERGKREELDKQKEILLTQQRFLMARINQLEVERSALMGRLYQMHLPTPTLVETPAVISPTDTESLLRGVVDSLPPDPFSDMGDAEAKRRGIGWDPDGTVRYQSAEDDADVKRRQELAGSTRR